MAVTIKEVATAANVSVASVSRTLAKPERVAPETRERVLKAARELGYTPNRAARSLITGRTGMLGVMVPDIANPFFPAVVKAVSAEAERRGFGVTLMDTDENPDAELGSVTALARQVDGIVLCSPRMTDGELKRAAEIAPCIVVNRHTEWAPSVAIDNATGVQQAMTHLRALGHRKIAWLAGPLASRSNRQRIAAVHDASADIELVELAPQPPTFDGGVQAADELMLSGATACLTYNDMMAFGLMSRLAAYGVRVPDEMSVVGFDDISLASMVQPGLTTVHMPMKQAGRQAVERLLRLVDGETDEAEVLPTRLVVRSTTARPHDPERTTR